MVLDNNKCYYCSRATEDGGHLFVKCKAVKEVWRALNLENERAEMEKFTNVHAMLDNLWVLDERKRLLIITFWWHWWSNRN